MSPNIRIVLVEPSHPGNIGAVARAMKNMALEELVLVRPKQFPHAEATARASGADDILARARVVESLAEGLEGCGFVAATTSRDRDQNFRIADVRDAAERIVAEARDRKSTRLNSSHANISYAVFCLKKKKNTKPNVYYTKKKKKNSTQ